MAPSALIVYYSFTNQTANAAAAAEKSLTNRGWNVRLCRLDFADRPMSLPLEPFWGRLFGVGIPSLLERPTTIVYDKSVLGETYDLVLLGSPSWFFSPAQPITSFIKSKEGRSLLAGQPAAAFVACRGAWRRNTKRIHRMVAQAGGRWLGAQGFGFDGTLIQTSRSWMQYLSAAGVPAERFAGGRVTPYGLSDTKLEQVGEFVTNVAALALDEPRGHE